MVQDGRRLRQLLHVVAVLPEHLRRLEVMSIDASCPAPQRLYDPVRLLQRVLTVYDLCEVVRVLQFPDICPPFPPLLLLQLLLSSAVVGGGEHAEMG